MSESPRRTRAMERRELMGLDRVTVASICGIGDSYLYKIETGRVVPSDAVAHKLGSFLRLFPGDLQLPPVADANVPEVTV